MKDITSLAQMYGEEAIALRRTIHQFPEIGFEEVMTSKAVQEFLDRHGIPYQANIAKTGILATIVGSKPGKTVLLRADMDALEMNEDQGNPLVSKIPNRMHACGHDGHTAGLCLAGAILNQLKDQLHGTVKLMFQPAEETEGGALPMIEEGVLEGVDAAFGAHLWGPTKEGIMKTKAGPMMAAPDTFSMRVIGKGGHGAMPHVTIDPIVIAAQIIMAIQTIVSRQTNPLDHVVVTIGQIHGGSAHNIIPNTVEMIGTIRTLNENTRTLIPEKLETIARNIAQAYGGNIEFNYTPKYPVLVNDKNMVEIAKGAFGKILGNDNVQELEEPNMGGEDFAYIAKCVPSAFVFLGITKDENNPAIHHHPKFQWDDANVVVLGKGMAQIALDYLSGE